MSQSKPSTSRKPYAQITEVATGLFGAGLPVSVIRRILPARLLRSWALAGLPASPVDAYSVPSGPNASQPPLSVAACGMPVRMGCGVSFGPGPGGGGVPPGVAGPVGGGDAGPLGAVGAAG